MKRLLSRLLDIISPRCCLMCGERLALDERNICASCHLHLPQTLQCETPNDNDVAKLFWGLAAVGRAASWLRFYPHSNFSRLIYLMKYKGRSDIAFQLGVLMAEDFNAAGFFEGIDIIVPVPLSRKRKRQRGYNQSERIAEGIGSVTNIGVCTDVLRRKHFLGSQTSKSRSGRQENVRDMFELKRGDRLKGKHVLLVDDIVTTGATLTACANQLEKIEGVRVSVATIGATVH